MSKNTSDDRPRLRNHTQIPVVLESVIDTIV
jgi:hypothetical protein